MNPPKIKRAIHGLKIKMRELVDAAEARDDDRLTESEAAEWRQMSDEVDRLKGDLDIAERQEQMNRDIEAGRAPAGRPSEYPVGPPPLKGERAGEAGGTQYRSLFGNPAWDGFEDTHDFLSAVRSGKADPRFEQRAQSTVVAVDGGLAVPTAMSELLFDGALDNEVIRPAANVFPMSTPELTIPIFDGEDRQTSIFGFAPTWVSEGSEGTVQTAKLRAQKLIAKKLMLFGEISNEARMDVRSFDQKLMQAMTRSLAWNLDDAFLRGTGAGQPLGILNATSTVTVSKRTGQAAGTVTYENLVDMQSRLLPGEIGNAVWIASESTMPQLLTMALVVGTGGISVPLLQRNGTNWSLHGIPLYFTEKLPTLGNDGDIMLCSRRHYNIGIRADVTLKRSEGVAFMRDSEVYRAVVRVDGQPAFSKPITLHNGNQVSPFVKLGERS